MKNLFVAVLLTMVSSASFAGYSCPGGRIDKWGNCEDDAQIGQRFYVDGLASCLHPCDTTEEQLIELAKVDAQKSADLSQSCGYRAVRTEDWQLVAIGIVNEGARSWTVARVGAIYTCLD